MDNVDCDSDEHWDVEKLHRCDLPLIPITKQGILSKHGCSVVPIANNQMGVSRKVDWLKTFWCVGRDPSSQQQPASAEAGNVTQDEDNDVGHELTVQTLIVNPQGCRLSVLEAPPPPVKKRRR